MVAALAMMVSLVPLGTPVTAQAAEADDDTTGEHAEDGGAAEAELLAEHAEAAERALETGEPARVESLTTATEETVALPEGGFEQISHRSPVRTREAGEWVDVDTTLQARDDGTVGPSTTTVDLALSGGGADTPLVVMEHDGAEVGLDWDAEHWGGPLPQPELDGDTATYPEVLPGVDLEVTVTDTGFSQVLVVQDREAANQPELQQVRFGNHTRGTDVATRPHPATGEDGYEGDGAEPSMLEVTNDNGEVVFVGDASRMWDSTGEISATALRAGEREGSARDARSEQARQAVMDVAVTDDEVAMTPDEDFLDDEETEYPVYIDPSYGCTDCNMRNYLVLYQEGGVSWNDDPDDLMKTGRVWDSFNNKTVTARSYFDFNVSSIPSNAHVDDARLYLTVNNSYYCSGTTEVYATGRIHSNMSWGNGPSLVSKIGEVNAYSGCPDAGNWTSGSGTEVRNYVRSLIDNGTGVATFGMGGADESATNDDWRRFRTNPGLRVTYNVPPDKPTHLAAYNGTENLGCGENRYETWVGDGDITLRARASDPDGDWVQARFSFSRNGSFLGTLETDYQPSGGIHQVTVPDDWLEDEGLVSWRVRARDEHGATSPPAGPGGSTSEFCRFMLDYTPPDTPGIESLDGLYPDADETDGYHGAVGKTGWFTLTPGEPTGADGEVDVDHYGWSLEPDKFDNIVPARSDGTAVIGVTPPEEGPNTIYVKSFDKAGNPSQRVEPDEDEPDGHEYYTFNVDEESGPIASWELDGDGSDSTGNAGILELRNGATFGDGYRDDGLHLDGDDQHAATGEPVLDTTDSFSVSAWAKLDHDDGSATVLSQDGTRRSGFILQYNYAFDRWAFTRPEEDVDYPDFSRALSEESPEVGEWTHLTGVYDAASDTNRLYVDGVLEAEASFSDTWDADGTFAVGRNTSRGNHISHFPGAIDEVTVHDRVISEGEIADRAAMPVERARYPLDEDAGTTAADNVGDHDATVTGLAEEGSEELNLLENPDLTEWDADGIPECWSTPGWGDHDWSVEQVEGRDSAYAAHLSISDHESGVRRIRQSSLDCAATVEEGTSYSVSAWYRTDTEDTALALFTHDGDGWEWWDTVDVLDPTDDWQQVKADTPPVPEGVERISFSLTLRSEGYLTTDDYQMVEAGGSGSAPGSVSWNPDGDGALFSGWGGDAMGEIVADLPGTVDTSGSFTLSGFARHDGVDEYARAAFAVSGQEYAPVFVGYRPDWNRWGVMVMTGSQDAPVIRTMLSDREVTEGMWAELAVTYDAAREELRFFVNGVAQSTMPDGVDDDGNHQIKQLDEPKRTGIGPLASDSGELLIGRSRWEGNDVDPWLGGVRDVRVHSGVAVTPGEEW
ncbi:LamG-like jellyroll fold domain-containing protein [Haloechinothrix sp. LS1_15]|uniref:LamG-like jellyroll fold domain-containing protein n=1 Tax=Haloechinothrix sp. LS1_15 TaxID=2652248 RepID=UPI002945F010|nr:LamG-like jellyroll fold domain-containing protein [Haloechinothrix sp. LS1_15]MDV6014404.1 LamG domain-containing protein [Haloechinothrix sp. LS1_15]